MIVLPILSFGQGPGRVWRVGFLLSRRRPKSGERAPRIESFLRRLRELGYVEGKNLSIEWRFAEDVYARLPEMAADLVRSRVDLIVTSGSEGIAAASKATNNIPIVFVGGTDVVAQGFVSSLARPGGNLTGITVLFGDIIGKQVELLKILVPKTSRIGVLYNSRNPANMEQVELFHAAGKAAAVEIVPIAVPSPESLESAFHESDLARIDALIWALDNSLLDHEHEIAELAAKHRVPCMGGMSDYPDFGGLVGYAPDQLVLWSHLAELVDKILKGANPAGIPVEQPTKLELVINKKAAVALGLTIPPELLVQADKVID